MGNIPCSQPNTYWTRAGCMSQNPNPKLKFKLKFIRSSSDGDASTPNTGIIIAIVLLAVGAAVVGGVVGFVMRRRRKAWKGVGGGSKVGGDGA